MRKKPFYGKNMAAKRYESKPSLIINQSIFFNTCMAQATISYFKDNRGEEQLKGKTGVGATE